MAGQGQHGYLYYVRHPADTEDGGTDPFSRASRLGHGHGHGHTQPFPFDEQEEAYEDAIDLARQYLYSHEQLDRAVAQRGFFEARQAQIRKQHYSALHSQLVEVHTNRALVSRTRECLASLLERLRETRRLADEQLRNTPCPNILYTVDVARRNITQTRKVLEDVQNVKTRTKSLIRLLSERENSIKFVYQEAWKILLLKRQVLAGQADADSAAAKTRLADTAQRFAVVDELTKALEDTIWTNISSCMAHAMESPEVLVKTVQVIELEARAELKVFPHYVSLPEWRRKVMAEYGDASISPSSGGGITPSGPGTGDADELAFSLAAVLADSKGQGQEANAKRAAAILALMEPSNPYLQLTSQESGLLTHETVPSPNGLSATNAAARTNAKAKALAKFAPPGSIRERLVRELQTVVNQQFEPLMISESEALEKLRNTQRKVKKLLDEKMKQERGAWEEKLNEAKRMVMQRSGPRPSPLRNSTVRSSFTAPKPHLRHLADSSDSETSSTEYSSSTTDSDSSDLTDSDLTDSDLSRSPPDTSTDADDSTTDTDDSSRSESDSDKEQLAEDLASIEQSMPFKPSPQLQNLQQQLRNIEKSIQDHQPETFRGRILDDLKTILEEDVGIITNSLSPCFPPEYDVYSLFMENYIAQTMSVIRLQFSLVDRGSELTGNSALRAYLFLRWLDRVPLAQIRDYQRKIGLEKLARKREEQAALERERLKREAESKSKMSKADAKLKSKEEKAKAKALAKAAKEAKKRGVRIEDIDPALAARAKGSDTNANAVQVAQQPIDEEAELLAVQPLLQYIKASSMEMQDLAREFIDYYFSYIRKSSMAALDTISRREELEAKPEPGPDGYLVTTGPKDLFSYMFLLMSQATGFGLTGAPLIPIARIVGDVVIGFLNRRIAFFGTITRRAVDGPFLFGATEIPLDESYFAAAVNSSHLCAERMVKIIDAIQKSIVGRQSSSSKKAKKPGQDSDELETTTELDTDSDSSDSDSDSSDSSSSSSSARKRGKGAKPGAGKAPTGKVQPAFLAKRPAFLTRRNESDDVSDSDSSGSSSSDSDSDLSDSDTDKKRRNKPAAGGARKSRQQPSSSDSDSSDSSSDSDSDEHKDSSRRGGLRGASAAASRKKEDRKAGSAPSAGPGKLMTMEAVQKAATEANAYLDNVPLLGVLSAAELDKVAKFVAISLAPCNERLVVVARSACDILSVMILSQMVPKMDGLFNEKWFTEDEWFANKAKGLSQKLLDVRKWIKVPMYRHRAARSVLYGIVVHYLQTFAKVKPQVTDTLVSRLREDYEWLLKLFSKRGVLKSPEAAKQALGSIDALRGLCAVDPEMLDLYAKDFIEQCPSEMGIGILDHVLKSSPKFKKLDKRNALVEKAKAACAAVPASLLNPDGVVTSGGKSVYQDADASLSATLAAATGDGWVLRVSKEVQRNMRLAESSLERAMTIDRPSTASKSETKSGFFGWLLPKSSANKDKDKKKKQSAEDGQQQQSPSAASQPAAAATTPAANSSPRGSDDAEVQDLASFFADD